MVRVDASSAGDMRVTSPTQDCPAGSSELNRTSSPTLTAARALDGRRSGTSTWARLTT
jgi:hypothetical protein